jgi:hypothetical protein
MTIKSKKVIESEAEIQIPCFLRDKQQTHMLALLDEKTLIKVTRLERFTVIVNAEPDVFSSDIADAWNNWHSMTETEFFDVYHEAVDSISLHPKLAV